MINSSNGMTKRQRSYESNWRPFSVPKLCTKTDLSVEVFPTVINVEIQVLMFFPWYGPFKSLWDQNRFNWGLLIPLLSGSKIFPLHENLVLRDVVLYG